MAVSPFSNGCDHSRMNPSRFPSSTTLFPVPAFCPILEHSNMVEVSQQVFLMGSHRLSRIYPVLCREVVKGVIYCVAIVVFTLQLMVWLKEAPSGLASWVGGETGWLDGNFVWSGFPLGQPLCIFQTSSAKLAVSRSSEFVLHIPGIWVNFAEFIENPHNQLEYITK